MEIKLEKVHFDFLIFKEKGKSLKGNEDILYM